MKNLKKNSFVVFLGLGANLKQPLLQLKSAISQLKQTSEISVQACSSFYRSAPIGPDNQPDFVNAVVKIHSTLSPEVLLKTCQGIENAHGRIRGAERWGPRTLDVDILLVRFHCEETERNGLWLISDDPLLTLPHPEICHRAFVTIPLLELEPDIEIAPGILLSSFLPALSSQFLAKLPDN